VRRIVDPALPRIRTDFMTLGGVRRIVDPALPRIGTDFMTLRGVMQIVYTTLLKTSVARCGFPVRLCCQK
jgi:hypothetical protein